MTRMNMRLGNVSYSKAIQYHQDVRSEEIPIRLMIADKYNLVSYEMYGKDYYSLKKSQKKKVRTEYEILIECHEYYINFPYGYSIAWVYLGKCFDNRFEVIFQIPFGTDLFLIRRNSI